MAMRISDITIHEAVEKDFEDYYKIRCEKADVYWMGFDNFPEYESLKKCFMNRIKGTSFQSNGDKRIYMITCLEEYEKKTVGFVQLSITKDGVEIGYSVIEKYQGQKIGTIALSLSVEIGLRISDKIYVEIWENNIASQTIAKKNGFVGNRSTLVSDRTIGGENRYRVYWYSPDSNSKKFVE